MYKTPPAGPRNTVNRAISGLFGALLLAASSSSFAATDTTIKVALFMPNSGPFASLGARQINGMKLALDEAGHAAGGKKIETVEIEEPTDVQAAVQKIKSITTGGDRVDALLGIFSASVGSAIRDQLHASKTITVITNTHIRNLTGSRKSPYIFRVSGTSWGLTQALPSWVVKKGVCKSIVTIASNYSAGQEFGKYFAEGFEKAGGQVIDKLWPALGSTDFSSYLTKIGQAKPDCVYPWLNGPDAIRFVQQFDQFGLKKQGIRIVGDAVTDPVTLQAQGLSAVGLYNVQPWDASQDNKVSKAFVAAYKKRYNADPDFHAFNGYIGTKALLASIAGVKGQVGDTEAWRAALRATSFPTPDGKNFAFAPETQTRRIGYSILEVVDLGGKPGFKFIGSLPQASDPGDDIVP